MHVQIVKHPLVAARLGNVRDKNTASHQFRSALQELTTLLVYEATRELAVESVEIDTPVAPTHGARLRHSPLLVPVLRAGLGMLDAARALLPDSDVGFVGLARDENTHQPHAYMESLPENLRDTHAIVLDPMIATGGSLLHCCQMLAARGCEKISVVCVLTTPEAVQKIKHSDLPVQITTASIDDGLNDDAYIVPGLGDAGDRQFGEYQRF